MPRKQMNLLQGTLDVLVLKALAYEARHGYGVAEWVCHYLYQLKLPPRWLAGRASPELQAELMRAEKAFLSGYFGEAPIPLAAVRLHEIQALFYRWSRAARAARWPGRQGLAKRARLFVKTRVFRDLFQWILRDLDAPASLVGARRTS